MAQTSSAQLFKLVGDTLAGQYVNIDKSYTLDDIKRAVGLTFHVAKPEGITFHTSPEQHGQLENASDIIAAKAPVSVRIDGRAVQDPQGPTELPFVGNFHEIYPDHLGNHFRLFQKYGHVIRTTNMGKTTYLTNSPDVTHVAMMESVYFTKKINENHPLWGIKDNTAMFVGDTETENWRIGHKFLPTAMGPKAVRHYTPLMQESVRNSFTVFDELAECGKEWNVYPFMVKLASQTIGKFALGMDFGHFTSVDAKLHPLIMSFGALLGLNKKVTSRGEWYRHLPFGIPAELRRVQKETYGYLQEAISGSSSSGLRNMPMEEAAIKASCVGDYLVNAVDEEGKHFPEGLVLANMMVVTGAGFSTTGSLLSWLIYCLVAYPGAQDRLLQELVDHDVDGKLNWTPDKANGMPYLHNFIKEGQRLHSPSYQPGRTTKTDVILPGGYRIGAGSVLIPAVHAIHTNPTVWRDPLLFDADRWDSDEIKTLHRYAYIPFAAGPRGCIGFNFALLEAKVLISELVYRYEFVRYGNEAIDYDPEFQLIRPLNLYVTARKRTVWPAKSRK
ncbi:cytochrome p450 monooxygenase [Grosmannia clavigera kw1407]|uniref:Cytochrome p450 monooxygenase n=1 Tax=Grosmannia clavigera (strain kw1407 / UAMH 11150) TaxID=655863 RepID=F0X7W9_GROCL|nr:cytochrome p450 monooxygenase [Grosmannia clavigera kw1407]EFX06633.1 cytochrome p450 monooxygenase [Grosmannia clavigera kw1407]